MMRLTILLTMLMFLIALAPAQREIRMRFEARLIGTQATAAKVKAVFDTRDRGTRSEAELQVEGERLPRGATFFVVIGNLDPIQVTTDTFGRFRYTARFNATNRPAIGTGTTVEFENTDGDVLMTGAFTRVR